MQYRSSIGVIRQNDWQQLIKMLHEYLIYIQQDDASSNDKINEVKLLIHKLQQHIDKPIQQSYCFNRWS